MWQLGAAPDPASDRAPSWVQASAAVPPSADVGLLFEAEVGPLQKQLQQAHEQLAAQQLQIQVGVPRALDASELQLGQRPMPAQITCVPKMSLQTVMYACHQVHVLTDYCKLACAVALMPSHRTSGWFCPALSQTHPSVHQRSIEHDSALCPCRPMDSRLQKPK